MAMQSYDFEKPIVELQARLDALRAQEGDANPDPQIEVLQKEIAAVEADIYGNLTPWQRVLISRKMTRPRALDYVRMLLTEWHEIKGDRAFRDDEAAICGLGRFDGEPIVVIGQQRGKDTKENVARNFGMMHPEGYRKALRVMRMAERFKIPILILIDTPGAYPGIGAEERGQAGAIAINIMEMFSIRVPIIGIVIGEGASGGALGIGVVDRMMMLENSWYCVISPEGCASILWRDGAMAPTAAEAMKMSANDLLELKLIDEIVPEPFGGADRDPVQTAANVRQAVARQLKELGDKDVKALLAERYDKYRKIGIFVE